MSASLAASLSLLSWGEGKGVAVAAVWSWLMCARACCSRCMVPHRAEKTYTHKGYNGQVVCAAAGTCVEGTDSSAAARVPAASGLRRMMQQIEDMAVHACMRLMSECSTHRVHDAQQAARAGGAAQVLQVQVRRDGARVGHLRA